jgi:hypothetical protein
MSLYDEICNEWYKKCKENLSLGNLSLYGYNRLLEDMQKRISDFLLLMERLAKLDKEVAHLDTVDEVVKALAYGIMELDDEERKKVLEFMKTIVEKKKGING